ncbi:MAG TPA: MASE1 domain-containing protein [Vicinamibacterales bacterium]|jgi:PAS domain S-box-containing protein|nr:MASE1 domain-containing protein [Vicinamibacterales bacterium]
MGDVSFRGRFPVVVGIGLTIAAAYFFAAEIGFRVAFVAQQVTIVWAPTGIAIASLLLCGARLWPAVWIAAFAANALTAAPLWTAAAIATGNTFEALAACAILDRYARFDPALKRVRDVVAFIVIAAALSTMVSATVGVVALCAAHVQPWQNFGVLWFDWWLGDAIGAVVVAPAILTVVRRDPAWSQSWLTASMLVVGAVFAADLVFGDALGARSTHPLEYILFPFVVAAAVREGPAVTSVLVLCVSATAIFGTVRGSGPFGAGDLHRGLILVQAYMGVLAGTGLLLASAMAERVESRRRETQAAEEVRRREHVLRLAQRAGGVAVFEWDFLNQVALCSEEFFRIFGLPQRDGVISAAEWGQYVHPEDRARMAAHLERVLRGEEAAATDYRICTPAGETRWLAYSGQIQNTTAGPRLIGTVTDVTSRVEAAAALRVAKTSAEAANHLKDQFLATLSHELRTPLNVIVGYARMLQDNSVPADQRQHAIDVIARNAAAQSQLVEDLLDMSRITTGKVRLDTRLVAPADVLNEALDGVRPAADAKSICVESDIAGVGTVLGDPTRLQQVYWNLLMNAVKFTESGGRVSVQLRDDNGYVETVVRDTGIGISVDFLPFVFEPFRQADAGPNRGHGGLGLGLAIARQLVELHGGTIQAWSDGAGRGATFTVRLPRSAAG